MPSYNVANVGAIIKPRTCALAFIAAGDAPAAETGSTIDRNGYGSAKVVISYGAGLADGETLSLAVEYETSPDGDDWSDPVVLQASAVVATPEATDGKGELGFDVDFSGLDRYIRVNFTPTLSAPAPDEENPADSDDDAAVIAAVIVLGGCVTNPAV